LKPVTSLPPSDPRERELGLHLNQPDCNSTGTMARPSEGCHGIAQTLLFAKKCVRDMLTKALNWAHVPAGISEDPGTEMSDPRMNFLECPDGSTILDIEKRI
jgi:hypothetical protein